MADYQVKRAKFVYIALFLVLLVGWSALLLGMSHFYSTLHTSGFWQRYAPELGAHPSFQAH
jgi:hypothetical protein